MNESKPGGNRLGTFGGVFTPSILTIFGVIMFLRAGYVIGVAGIGQALLILVLAKSVTGVTSLSISAISTNTPVAGGGAYFLISRALGPQAGGVIGLALYAAQAISVPFYILGFTEALVRAFPALSGVYSFIAILTALALFGVAFVGAQWATKTQYVIMSILGLSILVFMAGAALDFQWSTFHENWTPEYEANQRSFWDMFAIYFPAVTGIMAGVNMSGDLKNPARAIPRGTILAVLVGFVVYAAQIWVIGGAQTRAQLLGSSFETMSDRALWGTGLLVQAGVLAATLSSGLGSYLGAPRVLQAVARDKLIKPLNFFGQGAGPGDEPRRALVFTLGLTLAIILFIGGDSGGGAFNVLAATVTMFFLYTYGMVNLAAFVESFSRNPSFRPRFKLFHWSAAGFGSAAALVIAFLIDRSAAIFSALFLLCLYLVFQRMALKANYGDARWGYYYSRFRNVLFKLSEIPTSPKNWRPTVLVLTGNPKTRLTLALYGLWIGEERGLVTLSRVLIGDPLDMIPRRSAAVQQLKNFLREHEFQALVSVVVSSDLDEGLSALVQGHSFGPLRPTMVMLGWSSDPERAESFVHLLGAIQWLGMNQVILKDRGIPAETGPRRIDIWWRGMKNGNLMVLLAHLITLNDRWRDARIRVLRMVPNEAGREPATLALKDLLKTARLKAEALVLLCDQPFHELIRSSSHDASVVLIGFNVPGEAEANDFQQKFERYMTGLPTTLLVSAQGDVDLTA
ncbi:MAG: amino acid permease [Pseudomonadota bacterium]